MSLNPNAKAFSFSTTAPAFVPTGAATTAAPAPAPAADPVPEPTPEPTPEPAPEPAPVAESAPVEAPAEPVAVEETKEETPVVDAAPVEVAQEEDEKVQEVTEALSNVVVSEGEHPEYHEHLKRISELKIHDEREHVNVVFIGHVDAGKSTVSGQILLLTGQVDERTIAKYEKEAKEKNRDSWYLAFIMDTNEEERAKGKTVEVGRAHFDSDTKRYTLLDAPGHKRYVPNMISGAAQADVGILIISARKGEFETGFDRGGQTREHALLAKTLGITQLIVAINKMDESTVQWSQDRYDKIVKKLTPFLKKCGFKKNDLVFLPISGYTGDNLKRVVDPKVCPWYTERKSLLQVLDEMSELDRNRDGPVRIPVLGKYRDMGVVTVLGKVESGQLCKGDKLIMEPINKVLDVVGIEVNDVEVDRVNPGENVCVKVKGIEEEDIRGGFVLGSLYSPPSTACTLVVKLQVLPLLEHKPILTAGYQAMLHVHTLIEECQISDLLIQMDKKTGKAGKRRPGFVKAGDVVLAKLRLEQSIAVEVFDRVPQLGRFTLRDEGLTIALGRIVKLE